MTKKDVKTQIYKDEWLALNREIRQLLRKAFNMQNDEGCETVDNRVYSDGISNGQLAVVFTVEAMQEFLASKKTDIVSLFKDTINKVLRDQAVAMAVQKAEKNGKPYELGEAKGGGEDADKMSERTKAKVSVEKDKKRKGKTGVLRKQGSRDKKTKKQSKKS